MYIRVMLVCWALFQLLYRWIATLAVVVAFFYIPFNIFNGNGFYVFAFHKTGVTHSLRLPSPNEESLYPQNVATTLVGRLIAHIFFCFRSLRFNPPVCNIYTDFICKSKSNYTAKISTSFCWHWIASTRRLSRRGEAGQCVYKQSIAIEKLIS